MTSAELAKRVGVNLETVRYYERRGLLPKPTRTANGHRRYSAEAVSLLTLIRRAQALGFSLAEIHGLLRGLERPRAVCDDICQVIGVKLDQLDQELARLRALRTRLSKLRKACPKTRPLRECSVVIELQKPKAFYRE